jgi:hypothetical protein
MNANSCSHMTFAWLTSLASWQLTAVTIQHISVAEAQNPVVESLSMSNRLNSTLLSPLANGTVRNRADLTLASTAMLLARPCANKVQHYPVLQPPLVHTAVMTHDS